MMPSTAPASSSRFRASPGRILVVDDDPCIRRAFTRTLERAGHAVVQAVDGQDALRQMPEAQPEVVVSDVDMPTLGGVALLKELASVAPEVPVILCAGYPDLPSALLAVEHQAFLYLPKPVMPDRIRSEVAHALQRHRVAKLQRQAMETIVHSPPELPQVADLDTAFSSALDQLFMAFQPIVRWSDRSVLGYEALVRSRSKTLPHPGVILPAAEKLGRLFDLGQAIRRRCATDLERAPSEALLFINVHTFDLLDETLLSHRMPLVPHASRVVMEITERGPMERIPEVEGRLQALRSAGFRLAIDDIGAGYSGLTSFALMDPDVVKLDMALVRDIHCAPTKQKLVRALVSLCAELDVQVVAEGVETTDELQVLLDMGCDIFQGYLFGRPAPEFKAAAWPMDQLTA